MRSVQCPNYNHDIPTTLTLTILACLWKQGALQAIQYPDLKYRAKMHSLHMPLFDIYDIDPTTSTILLKGAFKKANLYDRECYRLYRRYTDFTVDKALQTLESVDQRGERSIFVVSKI